MGKQNSIQSAHDKVYAALLPLNDDERRRVILATCALFDQLRCSLRMRADVEARVIAKAQAKRARRAARMAR